MKIALEGGGTRSAFSAGVLASFAEAGIVPDAIVGSSSGCVNAAFMVSGQIERLCELWGEPSFAPTFIHWGRFLNPFAGPGVDVDAMVDEVFRKAGGLDVEAALGGKSKLYFTVTHVASGTLRTIHPSEPFFWSWLRAAMAIPVAYNRVVVVDGEAYVDGGICAPIPFDAPLEAEVSGPTIAIITRPIGVDKPSPSWWQRALIRALVPAELRGIVSRQHDFHNGILARLRVAIDNGDVLVISPPAEMTVHRLTRSGAQLAEAVEQGRVAGREWLQSHGSKLL